MVGIGETAPGFDADFGHGLHYRFFEAGLSGSPSGYGLPDSGTFISSTNSNVEFGFASYDANNVVDEINGGSATLTLSNPGEFTNLSFLTTSNNGAGFSITLNFADGSHVDAVDAFNADVYSGAPGVLPNIGSQNDDGYYASPYTALYEEDYALAPADSLKTLDSIIFTQGGGTNDAYLFAVSAEAVPEPSVWALLGVGGLLLAWSARAARTRLS